MASDHHLQDLKLSPGAHSTRRSFNCGALYFMYEHFACKYLKAN